MIVVADTSPISYLILIDEVNILPRLYGKILIPRGVFNELTASNAPDKVRSWFDEPPSWLETRDLNEKVDAGLLALLDLGESEAIQLAKNLRADLVLIDDLLARNIAKENGLKMGLIGVLAAASKAGIADTDSVISRLEQTNFFVSDDLIEFLRSSKK